MGSTKVTFTVYTHSILLETNKSWQCGAHIQHIVYLTKSFYTIVYRLKGGGLHTEAEGPRELNLIGVLP